MAVPAWGPEDNLPLARPQKSSKEKETEGESTEEESEPESSPDSSSEGEGAARRRPPQALSPHRGGQRVRPRVSAPPYDSLGWSVSRCARNSAGASSRAKSRKPFRQRLRSLEQRPHILGIQTHQKRQRVCHFRLLCLLPVSPSCVLQTVASLLQILRIGKRGYPGPTRFGGSVGAPSSLSLKARLRDN